MEGKTMSDAMQELYREHELIVRALEILERMAAVAGQADGSFLADAAQLSGFLKAFADKCHHGKEEGLLFPALCRFGLSKEQGPVAVMLHEHGLGRQLIGKIDEAIEGEPFNAAAFTEAARSYIYLLRNHIHKENNILFPMAETRLSEPEKLELKSNFRIHEQMEIGRDNHDELIALLDELINKYL